MNFKIGNIGALQLFQLFRFAAVFLISILMSKSSLTTAQIGQYEGFIFIAGMISFFWVSGLSNSFLSLFPTYPEKEKSPLFFNAFVLQLGFSLLAVIILAIAWRPITAELNVLPSDPVFRQLLLYLFLSGPISLLENFYVLKNRPNRLITYGLFTFLLQILLIGLPILLSMDMDMILLGLNASVFIRMFWLIIFLIRFSEFKLDKSFLFLHLKTAFPLILVSLIGGSAPYIDGAIVSAWFSQEEFAVFRYGARELPLVTLLASAFSSAMVPQVSASQDIDQPLAEIKKKTSQLMNFLFPLTAVLMLSSEYLYPIVFNSDFIESAIIFNIYLLLISSKLIFPQTILMGLRENTVVLKYGAFSIGIHLILALILGLYFGLPGVAFAAWFSNLSEKIFFAHYLNKQKSIRVEDYLDRKKWLLYNFLLLMIFVYTLI